MSDTGATHFRVRDIVRLALLDRSTTCTECGGVIPPGDHIWAWPGDPAPLTHADECPKPWTPTVLDGDGQTTPPTRSLLAAVATVIDGVRGTPGHSAAPPSEDS